MKRFILTKSYTNSAKKALDSLVNELEDNDDDDEDEDKS